MGKFSYLCLFKAITVHCHIIKSMICTSLIILYLVSIENDTRFVFDGISFNKYLNQTKLIF